MRAALLRFVAFVVLAALACLARADEPRAQFRLDGGTPHVDIPFELQMLIEGFDESPAPDQPPLAVAGATVVARRDAERRAVDPDSMAAGRRRRSPGRRVGASIHKPDAPRPRRR
jgi:hypothetical protein